MRFVEVCRARFRDSQSVLIPVSIVPALSSRAALLSIVDHEREASRECSLSEVDGWGRLAEIYFNESKQIV